MNLLPQEPTTTAQKVAEVTQAGVVTAIGLTVHELFGIELQALLWALVGGFFGAAYAKKHPDPLPVVGESRFITLSRVVVKYSKAALSYIMASLSSTLIATAAVNVAGIDSPQVAVVVRNLGALMVSAAFYPLLYSFIENPVGFLSKLFPRVFGSSQPMPPQSPPNNNQGDRQ